MHFLLFKADNFTRHQCLIYKLWIMEQEHPFNSASMQFDGMQQN